MVPLYKATNYYLNAGTAYTFRSGHKFQILFFTHGNCTFQVNEREWFCMSPDMVLLKPQQSFPAMAHKTYCTVLGVSVSADTLAALSDDTCDLVQKFQFAPYPVTVIQAEVKASMLLRNIITKLDKIKEEGIALGAQLYEKSLFTAFLVIFIRACVQSDRVYQTHQKKMLIIDNVFEYISQHLTEDLSLDALEKAFFVSGEHISREFKKSTGMTLHAYITRSRIDLSKRYILQGISVRDVCQLCGFSSYNHFFKIFKKECGMTPMAYYQKFKKPDAPPAGQVATDRA